MAKNRNTFAKRNREVEKKRKAQEKADRRKERKDRPSVSTLPWDGAPAPAGEHPLDEMA